MHPDLVSAIAAAQRHDKLVQAAEARRARQARRARRAAAALARWRAALPVVPDTISSIVAVGDRLIVLPPAPETRAARRAARQAARPVSTTSSSGPAGAAPAGPDGRQPSAALAAVRWADFYVSPDDTAHLN